MTDRLHKVLAHCGVASRRECEQLIVAGRVAVNGRVVTELGTKVDPGSDDIRVDGERVRPERKVYYLVHKPKGTISTNRDERGRPRVVDLVPEARRIYTVGRLDEASEGLLILTNDGDLANVISHPRYRVDKTYRVTVRGTVERTQLEQIESGVWLAEGKSAPAEVQRVERKGDRTVVTVTLWEGRNRELRRIFAKVGLRVTRLVRTAIGPLKLRDLAPGAYRRLAPRELAFVRAHDKDAEAASRARKKSHEARGRSRKGARPEPRRSGPRGKPGRRSRGDKRAR